MIFHHYSQEYYAAADAIETEPKTGEVQKEQVF